MHKTKHLAHIAPLLALCTSVAADFVSLSENFSTRQQFNYSTWLVGCFGGNADIRTMDAEDSLVVYSGSYDLNWNGSPLATSALANNAVMSRLSFCSIKGRCGIGSTATSRAFGTQPLQVLFLLRF